MQTSVNWIKFSLLANQENHHFICFSLPTEGVYSGTSDGTVLIMWNYYYTIHMDPVLFHTLVSPK